MNSALFVKTVQIISGFSYLNIFEQRLYGESIFQTEVQNLSNLGRTKYLRKEKWAKLQLPVFDHQLLLAIVYIEETR